jgi:hypothetical protein
MTERPSVTSFVMEERLPWPDDGPIAGIEGPFDAAVIHDAGELLNCSIRKISTLGATLRGNVRKMPGDEIAVELATGQRPIATIDWVSGGEAGVRFKQPVDMLALINRQLINQPTERRAMPRVDEAVEHLLAAGLLELDLQLVAFDRGDGAVAELAVEHALAEREVVAALVAEADGGGALSTIGCGSALKLPPLPELGERG